MNSAMSALPGDVACPCSNEWAVAEAIRTRRPTAFVTGRNYETEKAQHAAPNPMKGEARTRTKARIIHMTDEGRPNWRERDKEVSRNRVA